MQPDLWNQPAPIKPARATRQAGLEKVIEHEAATADRLGLSGSQREVWAVIRRNVDVTNQEIADLLDWGINRVTPRVLELRQKGMVTEGRKRACTRTGNVAQAWQAIEPNPCRAVFGRGPAAAQCGTCQWFAVHKMECGYRKGEVHRHFWASCANYKKAFGSK